MYFAPDGRTEELRATLLDFMDSDVHPAEAVFARQMDELEQAGDRWAWSRTPVLAALRDDYGGVLDQYRDLVNETFTGHGGNELDRAGDGLFHGFPSARRAVVAALGVRTLRIGEEVDPGVPWTLAQTRFGEMRLALKSGNFGGRDFFSRAFDRR